MEGLGTEMRHMERNSERGRSLPGCVEPRKKKKKEIENVRNPG